MAAETINKTAQDEAARAGWLYYVGGLTQDQIAQELGVSRQRAQRLVSRAMSDGLVHVRLDHRISSCIEMENALRDKFNLRLCRVAPAIPGTTVQLASVAPFAAEEMVRFLSQPEPITVALGTGRTLRAAIEEIPQMACEQHKLVSLLGNIASDGTASFYDVIMRIADRVRAPHYPMPIPVVAANSAEREQFLGLFAVQNVMKLGKSADVTFVGVGQMDHSAPILKDGFISQAELSEMLELGAVGEIASWAYDHDGKYIEYAHNLRVCGVRVEPSPDQIAIGIVADKSKVTATLAALKGHIINGLILDELTATELLAV